MKLTPLQQYGIALDVDYIVKAYQITEFYFFLYVLKKISVCGSKKFWCFGTIKKNLRNFCTWLKFGLFRKMFVRNIFQICQMISVICFFAGNWGKNLWLIDFLNVFKFENEKLRLCKYLDAPMGLNFYMYPNKTMYCTGTKYINSIFIEADTEKNWFD